MKKEKPQVLFPGDWIEYVEINDDHKHERKIGMITEITDDLDLIVSTGSYNRWKSEGSWTTTMIGISQVIKKFPHFAVFPLPGKIKDDEDAES